MSRLRAEIMPTVTVPPRLNGLPIAITQSPTRIFWLSPNVTAFSGFSGFTLRTARSVLESVPSSSAVSLVPSLKLMTISSALSMTWLLVTMMPFLPSTTKPEPSDCTRRGTPPLGWLRRPRRLKKSSKNSWNGEPSGSFGGFTEPLSATICVVETLTTASSSRSAEVRDRVRAVAHRHCRPGGTGGAVRLRRLGHCRAGTAGRQKRGDDGRADRLAGNVNADQSHRFFPLRRCSINPAPARQ